MLNLYLKVKYTLKITCYRILISFYIILLWGRVIIFEGGLSFYVCCAIAAGYTAIAALYFILLN